MPKFNLKPALLCLIALPLLAPPQTGFAFATGGQEPAANPTAPTGGMESVLELSLRQQNKSAVAVKRPDGSGQTIIYNGVKGTILGYDQAAQPASSLSGFEIHPDSSKSLPGDAGLRMHTQLRILMNTSGQPTLPVPYQVAIQNLQSLQRSPYPRFPAYLVINTPSSIACIYGLAVQSVMQPPGCNPNYTTVNAVGGGGAIALVDAYHYATAAADLRYFSQYFNLPPANLQVIYVGGAAPYITGSQPAVDSGWNLEEALDIEWAHAMAPYAKIFLVEAQDNSHDSLLLAVQAAQYLVAHNGGGEISMSYGSEEFSSETTDDAIYAAAPSNVVQFASSGDAGSIVQHPSSSPYVISVGGTSFARTPEGHFAGETAWDESGGGISQYEARPSFQSIAAVESVVGTSRGTPDIAMLADPSTGVGIYVNGNWMVVGGTSLASPIAAGILNFGASVKQNFESQATAITTIYDGGPSGSDARDITSGSCGSHSAATGYDLCTGWGSLFPAPVSCPTGNNFAAGFKTVKSCSY